MRIVALSAVVSLVGCLSSGTPPTSAVSASTATAKIGQVVQLDGSKSVDKNKLGLTYSWRFVSVPDGANPVFNDATAANPTFTPDIEGAFAIGLVVKSGTATSNSAQTTVTASGSCFTIDPAQTGFQGAEQALVTVSTDAACIAAQGNFKWELLSAPAGSRASIAATGIDPHFVPDVAGTYQITYATAFGATYSAPKAITLTVTGCGGPATITTDNEPSAQFSVGEIVNLRASANSVAQCVQDIASYQWQLLSAPTGADSSTSLFDHAAFGLDAPSKGQDSTIGLTAVVPGQYVMGLSLTDAHGTVTHQQKTIAMLPVAYRVKATSTPTKTDFGFALDGTDTPLIAYTDDTAHAVYLATLDAKNFVWNRQLVYQDVSATPVTPTKPAVAMLNGQPCVAFFHGATPANLPGLVMTCRNGTTTIFPGPSPIDALGADAIGVQMLATSTNTLKLLYEHNDTAVPPATYRIANCANATCVSPPANAFSLSATSHPQALLSLSNDIPRVTYYDTITAGFFVLKTAVCPTSNCALNPVGTATAESIASETMTGAAVSFAIASGVTDNQTRVLYVNDSGFLSFTTCTTSAATPPVTTCQISATQKTEVVDQSSKFQFPAMVVNSAGAGAGNVTAIWYDTYTQDMVKATRDATGVWTKTPQGLFGQAFEFAVTMVPTGQLSLLQTKAGTAIAAIDVALQNVFAGTQGVRIWQRPQ